MNRDQDQQRYQRNVTDTMETGDGQTPRRRRSQAARLRDEQQTAQPPRAEFSHPAQESDEGDYASGRRPVQPASRYERGWQVGGEDEPQGYEKPAARYTRPVVRPEDADEFEDFDTEDEYDGGYDDDDDGRGGSHWWMWVVIVLLVLALLAGVTFFFARHSDIAIPRVIEPAVSSLRKIIATPTPEPIPTPEPTPEPLPTPEPAPQVNEAVVTYFSADPAMTTSLDTPITFQVTTTMQTDRVQILDSNGQVLMELTDGYSDTAEGRVWRMMYYFASSYEDLIEACPGNVSGWNDAGAAGTYVSVREPQPEPTAEPQPEPQTQAQTQPENGFAENTASVSENVYIGGQEQESFSRENAIALGNATDYTRQGEDRYLSGVTTFRASGMRQNAAYGNVAAAAALEETWKAETGAAVDAANARTMQPAIIKWNANIRKSMPLEAEALAKSALKEVIFAAADGKVYFYDLDNGAETRDAIDVGVPLSGAASVYPNGLPILSVGGADADDSGLFVYSLLNGKLRCKIRGEDTIAFSGDRGFYGASLIDPNADTIVSAGGNGLVYTLTLNKTVETKESDGVQLLDNIGITAPSLELYRAQSAQQDTTVRAAMAACGEYAYYAMEGGVINCVNLNTLTSRWTLQLAGKFGPALALDDTDGMKLYAVSTGAAVNAVWCIDAETGAILWTKEITADAVSAPVIGTDGLDDTIVVTAGSTVYALNKADGSEKWTHALGANAASAPIALYAAADETSEEAPAAWIAQGDDNGSFVLLNAYDGTETATLALGAGVIGSPAAFNDVIVVATADGALHGVTVK